jgi:hypothetical protein
MFYKPYNWCFECKKAIAKLKRGKTNYILTIIAQSLWEGSDHLFYVIVIVHSIYIYLYYLQGVCLRVMLRYVVKTFCNSTVVHITKDCNK